MDVLTISAKERVLCSSLIFFCLSFASVGMHVLVVTLEIAIEVALFARHYVVPPFRFLVVLLGTFLLVASVI